MTTKEALLRLRGMKWHIEQGNPIWPGKYISLALDMAIEALKKQSEEAKHER
jgi:hypothetical protein